MRSWRHLMTTAKTSKSGKVEKIVKSVVPNEKDKAQIHIDDADPLYREIRIENELQNAAGETVELKPGAEVDVHIEADEADVEKKRNQTM
jgi:quercetin dioxygenase-like cupin family protein